MTAQILSNFGITQFDLAANTFKLMADKTRLRIIWALANGEHSVNDLAAHVSVSPAAVSQHLAKLRSSGVVVVRRDGNRAYYSLENGHVRHLVEEALLHADHVVGSGHLEFFAANNQASATKKTPRRRSTIAGE